METKEIGRAKAKLKIAEKTLATLLDKEKNKTLQCFLNYDVNGCLIEELNDIKEDFPNISTEALEIIQSEACLQPPFPDALNHFFIEDILLDLLGVTNLYLEQQLNHKFKINEDEEQMGVCPCCEFYSIGFGEDGLWDICPVCFWENGGDGPNHMPLSKAQENFKLYGAITETTLPFVDPDGKIKYKKIN